MLVRRASTDPDELAAAIPGGRFGVLPVSPAPFSGAVLRADLSSGLSLREVSFSGPCFLRSEFHGTALAFVFPSLDGAPCLFEGVEQRGLALCLRYGGDTPTLRSLGAHRAGTVTLSESVLQRAMAALEGRNTMALPPVSAQLKGEYTQPLRRLAALHCAASRGLEGLTAVPTVALRFWEDGLLTALVETLTAGRIASEHGARRRQTSAFARIERCIAESGEEPVGLLHICTATGMPRRTVEATVRAHTGLSANAYLRARRMALARATLCRPLIGETVTTIALRFGFPESGRFAQRYAAAYGETPSATLARARDRAPP